MERTSDNWKKIPLLVIGESPVALPGAISLLPANLASKISVPLNDFYLLIAVPQSDVISTLTQLETLAVNPDQIIVYLPTEAGISHPHLPFFGLLDFIEGEGAEEFRARLMGKLEGQRQKKLHFALHVASEGGIARRLNETELQRTLDTTRIAHALACSFALSPHAHSQTLHDCLEGNFQTNTSAPWTPDISPERLICEASKYILECLAKDGVFRDAVRERASTLPFKMRTELLHHVENCLGLLLGGKSHAA